MIIDPEGKMKRICVYCGASPGVRRGYVEAAQRLGRELVDRGFGLVYGGGKVGIMGILADTVLDAGGEVTGVITEDLVGMEVAHTGVTDLQVMPKMHERKAMMAKLADGFIALPGGLGTFEEFLEVLTWTQLGFHQKPCGLMNVMGYYDGLLQFLAHAVGEGFMLQAHREMVLVDEDPGKLLDRFEHYERPNVDKAAWAKRISELADE